MSQDVIRLESASSTVILTLHPFPVIVYWGARLAPDDDAAAWVSLDYPVPNGRLDRTAPLSLLPAQGEGMFSSPGLEGHRDGQDWAPIFSTRTHTFDQKAQRLTVSCEDAVAQLGLELTLTLDAGSGVLGVKQTLVNQGNSPYWLQRFALTLPIADRAPEVMGFHGRWLREFQTHRIRPEHGAYVQTSRRGRHHEYFPGMVVGTPHFTETQGEVWGAHLAWSGDHQLRFDTKSDGRRYLQAEALYQAGECQLMPGARQETPWLYAAYGAQGLNDMSLAFHQFVRRHLLTFPGASTRPVQLNIWEGVYFDHDPAYIMAMATEAARLGVERFIIDDGWFLHRRDDRAGLGDWYVDRTQYPDGLQPVIAHVHQQGMQFGLWVEPEMINPDSDLYRAHPDWVLGIAGYTQPTGRHQYVLDLCNDAVFDYLLTRLDALLTEHSIDYIKWDMNRDLVQPSHQGQAASQRQTARLYALLSALRTRHPHTEFESCASGGARIDYGVLAHVQRFWTSDSNDALERQAIQWGMSYFFPPEVMGAHIGAERCHSSGRRHTIGFRGLTALPGHMGIELDPLKSDAKEQVAFAHYIALHKQWRTLLHTGRSVRLETLDPQRVRAHAVVTARQAVVWIAQLTAPEYAMSEALRIPYLVPDTRYRVTVVDRPEAVADSSHTMRAQVPWMTQPSFEATGDWLAKAGLRLPQMDPETAMMLVIEAC